jgi:hypothetical protein
MITFSTITLVSLAMGPVPDFPPTHHRRGLDSQISLPFENTNHVQLASKISKTRPFELAARDEQTEDYCRIQTCTPKS